MARDKKNTKEMRQKDKNVLKKGVSKKDKTVNMLPPDFFDDKTRENHKVYLSYSKRLIINTVLLVCCVIALMFTIMMSFSITKNGVVSYSDKSNIDYKVMLKSNEFYDTPYLNKGMAYVASIIDKINITFNYDFSISKTGDYDLTNKVIARLVISSQNNSNIFYENEYEIEANQLIEVRDESSYKFNKEVVIDYDYYNSLANRFKAKYAVNTNSYLEVYLVVDEVNAESNSFDFKNQTKTILSIPLSQQEVNIGLTESVVNQDKQLLYDLSSFKVDFKFIILDVVLLIVTIVLLIKFMRKVKPLLLNNGNSNYDKYVNKILRGYDRLIVNVKTAPELYKYNVIKVESFEELVDLRDNIKEPIRYFVITKHQKCEFFITNHNDLYLYVVKGVDLE